VQSRETEHVEPFGKAAGGSRGRYGRARGCGWLRPDTARRTCARGRAHPRLRWRWATSRAARGNARRSPPFQQIPIRIIGNHRSRLCPQRFRVTSPATKASNATVDCRAGSVSTEASDIGRRTPRALRSAAAPRECAPMGRNEETLRRGSRRHDPAYVRHPGGTSRGRRPGPDLRRTRTVRGRGPDAGRRRFPGRRLVSGRPTLGTHARATPSPTGCPPPIRCACRNHPPGTEPAFQTNVYRGVSASKKGPFPLVTFAHGSGGLRDQSTFLTTHIASWGFVIGI